MSPFIDVIAKTKTGELIVSPFAEWRRMEFYLVRLGADVLPGRIEAVTIEEIDDDKKKFLHAESFYDFTMMPEMFYWRDGLYADVPEGTEPKPEEIQTPQQYAETTALNYADAELDNSERFPTENLDAENLRRLKLYLYNNYLSWGIEEVTAYAENRKREEEADALNERKGACSYGN